MICGFNGLIVAIGGDYANARAEGFAGMPYPRIAISNTDTQDGQGKHWFTVMWHIGIDTDDEAAGRRRKPANDRTPAEERAENSRRHRRRRP